MSLFKLEHEKIEIKYFLILVIVAYLFSIAVRMIWVYQFSGIEQFSWHNQLMINTNDGYYFASWVQAIVDGVHQYNPRVETNLFKYAVVFVTVLAVKLGVSIDTAILYMPAVISSIVVIPIILIGRLYGYTTLGFFAALLGSIGWSYYNRTMIGYYDTDMFSAMATMFIVYFLVRLIKENSFKNTIYAFIILSIYPFLYDQGQAIVYAMGLMYIAYVLLFHFKDKSVYKSIIFISIALMPVSVLIKLVLVVGVVVLLLKVDLDLKYLIFIALLTVFYFLYEGNVFGLVYSKVSGYISKGTEEGILHFYSVNQTVREAGKIPFETMANRIIGSTIGVILALIGYVLFLIKHRSFVVSLPLVGIGIFSLWGGLRFTVYAVPVAALGAVYLFYILSSFIEKRGIRYALVAILTALMIYPNINHIINYKVPTVFTKEEVEVLDKLKSISNPKDYTIAWWDYGYPIWYYSDTNTLIDGGKHNHDNFIVSQILTTNYPQEAYNLSRISVEEYVKSKGIVADIIFKDKDPNKFLDSLKNKDVRLPKKARDIYLYLPNRMLNIFPTIDLFSNLDLSTGNKKYNNFFFISRNFKENQNFLELSRGMIFDKRRNLLKVGNNTIPLGSITITEYDKNKKLYVKKQVLFPQSKIHMIFMKNYNQIIVLDERMYNSIYIQMFVLENYDKNLFEPVILTPLAKVYKLK